MLTMFCSKETRRWDEYLQQTLMAYRSSRHSSTEQTPNMMMLGREVTLPLQAVIGKPQQNNDEPEEGIYVQDLQNSLKTAHDFKLARITLKKETKYQKKYYDIKSTKRSLKVGQVV